MKTERELELYLVSNPAPFTRFDDHEAALEIQVFNLVQNCLDQQDDPVMLIEQILGIEFQGDNTLEGIAYFIIRSDQMRTAMFRLSENWDAYDPSVPEMSMKTVAGTTRQQALEVYQNLTLASYLEALANIYE